MAGQNFESKCMVNLRVCSAVGVRFNYSNNFQLCLCLALLLASFLATPFNAFNCGIIPESFNDIASRLIRSTYLYM